MVNNIFSLLSASGKRYCWHSDLKLILGTFLKTTSTISIPLCPTDLTQHWTRPCKLPGARFGIGLLLQFFLINQVQFIRQSINISFKNITSKRHLLITLWKTLNQHWVLIAGSTRCCQLLFSLTAHFPIQDMFGGAQTHFGAPAQLYRPQNVHNRNQSVPGHHSSFLKIDYRQGKKETCNTFCTVINEDPMLIDLMSSLTLLVKLTFN